MQPSTHGARNLDTHPPNVNAHAKGHYKFFAALRKGADVGTPLMAGSWQAGKDGTPTSSRSWW